MIAISRPLLCLTLMIALWGTAGCTPTVANRGTAIEADKLAEVKVGNSTREEVLALLGSPTQVGTFDENVWYYFGRTTRQYSFLDPEIINQQAVTVRFDDAGIVTSIDKSDETAARDIVPVDRRTPTYGHETTFLEQLVGNIGQRTGKINKKVGEK